jgi:hypothetical protein
MMPRQDSTTDQLASVREAAEKAGLTDAVAWMDDPKVRVSGSTFVRLYQLAVKEGCYDAADFLAARFRGEPR